MGSKDDATEYIAIKPDRTIQGEFYRYLYKNRYDMYVDGAANVMLIRKDQVDKALACLDEREIRYEIL